MKSGAVRKARPIMIPALAGERLTELYDSIYESGLYKRLHDTAFEEGQISCSGLLAKLELPLGEKKGRLVTLSAKLRGGISITGYRANIVGLPVDTVYNALIGSESTKESSSFMNRNGNFCDQPSSSLRPASVLGVSLASVEMLSGGLNHALGELEMAMAGEPFPRVRIGSQSG